MIKNIFSRKEIPNVPLAGNLKHFLSNWQIISTNSVILGYVGGYKIPLLETPCQAQPPPSVKIDCTEGGRRNAEEGSNCSSSERPKAVSELNICCFKEVTRRSTCNKLKKKLNSCVEYDNFKMEGIFLLNEEDDYHCKMDLKDAYSSVPLHQDSQRYVRFQWQEKLYQFLCLRFGLSSAPRVFTKLMKVPISILRKLNIILILYLGLDDIH